MELVERKRSVVLNADVVGYSRLVAHDDLAAVELLLAAMRRIMDLIARAGGRVVDATGDNLMAELPNETAALRCALEVQRTLAERNHGRSDEQQLHMRIGLHGGELLARGERLFGDVVNAAARLQAAAPADGIVVSGAIAERVERALQELLADLGQLQLKNMPEAINAYGIRM
jgi:class 3 adenylate cyclase